MTLLLILATLLTILPTSQAASLSDISYKFKALKFTQEPSSFVQFVPDFSRYTQAISACVWIKSLGSAAYPTVFYYGTGSRELTMLDNGDYICILQSCMYLKSKFSVRKGTWYHACVTWQLSTRTVTHKYYVNGQLVGSQQTTAGRTLPTGRTLTLGNWGGNRGNHEFGGEMVYLNFYAKELSQSEVQEMVSNGMCADLLSDRHKEVRLVKWEDMVRKTRSGRVTELDMFEVCLEDKATQIEQLKHSLNQTTQELAETQQALEKKTEAEKNLTKKLEHVSDQLNSTLMQLNTTSLQLNTTLSLLTNVSTELNRTSDEVQEISTRLNQTKLDLRRANQELEMYNNSRNEWDWEIFKSEQYLNNTITSEQAEQLRASWDSVARKDTII